MFCQSFPPHRAKTDRERKQFWLTLLSIILLISGFTLLIVWLSFFLQAVMRVQNGANEYNNAVASYDPSPIAGWLPGMIGESQAVLFTIPVVILGETYSVDTATSTIISTVLTSSVANNSAGVPVVQPLPAQVYYSFVDVDLFDRSPLYVKKAVKEAECPRAGGCSNETMEVYCRTNFGPLAQYRGAGCEAPSSSLDDRQQHYVGDNQPPTTCGQCEFNMTLRTYCVVVGPSNPNNGSIPQADYAPDPTYRSCYYPFEDPNADQDYFLNFSAKSYADQFPTSVAFVIRKSDDPFIIAQLLTQGTMILQTESLKYYVYFIIPAGVLLVAGITVFFVGIKVGQRREATLGQNRSNGSSTEHLQSSRFKVVSGRLAVAVVVNSQNGQSIPLLIDPKEYNHITHAATSSSNFTSNRANGQKASSGSTSRQKSRSTSPASSGRKPSQESVAILTANGEDGTVTTSEGHIMGCDGGLLNYGGEPVGYGDEPNIISTSTSRKTTNQNFNSRTRGFSNNPQSANHINGDTRATTSAARSTSPGQHSSNSNSKGGGSIRRIVSGGKKGQRSTEVPTPPLQQPLVGYGDPDGVGYGDLDTY